MFAQNLGGSLPVVQSKPEGDLFLKCDVAHENRAVQSSRSGLGEVDSLDVNISICICREVGDRGGDIRIDGWQACRRGRQRRREWEVRSVVSLSFSLGILAALGDVGWLSGSIEDPN